MMIRVRARIPVHIMPKSMGQYFRMKSTAEASSASSDFLIPGFATVAGTEAFVSKAQLPLHHRFNRSQLCINPIIHGPPTRIVPATEEMQLLAQSLALNFSNCAYVYEHASGTYGARQRRSAMQRSSDKPASEWYQPGLHDVLQACKMPREQFVALAGLGRLPSGWAAGATREPEPASVSDLLTERLADACQLSGLRRIDFALLEVTDTDFVDGIVPGLDEALAWLGGAVEAELLQGFGVFIDTRPYSMHTPPQATSGPLAMYPSEMENRLSLQGSYCELVAYNISPTSAIPATYPMLPASLDQYNPAEYAEEGLNEINPFNTTLSRMSIDGFLARRGRGDGDVEGVTLPPGDTAKLTRILGYDEIQQREELHSGMAFPLASPPEGVQSEAAELICQVLDDLCPPLRSTPRLQDKTLRTILSIGIDCVVADADLAPLLGKLDVNPTQMLHSDDTDGLFGVFMLPEELT